MNIPVEPEGIILDEQDLICIPCITHNVYVDGIITKRYLIVDLTDADNRILADEKLFPRFDGIIEDNFAQLFYKERKELRWNLNLIFVIDEKFDKSNLKYESNFRYVRKRFVHKEDLEAFLPEKDSSASIIADHSIAYNDTVRRLGRFNLISGDNGSGKSMLLKQLSKETGEPIYCFSTDDDIPHSDSWHHARAYFNQLWGISQYETLDSIMVSTSSATRTLAKMACALEESDRVNRPLVLLDDIPWGRLDSQRTLNIIETLDNYSMKRPVVLTSFRENVKELMAKRVYGPNIINL